MGKTKLTAEQAEEYTHNLGQITAGDYGLIDFAINTLGVPAALGYDDPRDWVEERLGGYVRYGVEQRREAVAQLTADGKSGPQIANILGISESTVTTDRAFLQASVDAAQEALGAGDEPPDTSVDAIRALIDQGKTNAEIAVATGLSPTTIRLH